MEAPQTRKCCPNPAAEATDLLVGLGKAGRWQEYRICLLREGSFSTTPACHCPPLSGVLFQPGVEGAWLGCQKNQREPLLYGPSLPPFGVVRNFLARVALSLTNSFQLRRIQAKGIHPSLAPPALALLPLSCVLFWAFQDTSPMAWRGEITSGEGQLPPLPVLAGRKRSPGIPGCGVWVRKERRAR